MLPTVGDENENVRYHMPIQVDDDEHQAAGPFSSEHHQMVEEWSSFDKLYEEVDQRSQISKCIADILYLQNVKIIFRGNTNFNCCRSCSKICRQLSKAS